MSKERIRLLSDGRFRIRVVRESGRLIAIHYEAYRGDTGTWAVGSKTIRLPKEEVRAAAELLGIKKGGMPNARRISQKS